MTIYIDIFSSLRLIYICILPNIFKSHCQTLDKVVIDPGNCEKSLGITFVAISRVKKFKVSHLRA